MVNQIELPYCPHCGEQTFTAGPFKPWQCSSCDFKIYPNVAAAAAVFILDNEDRILFIERGREPGKGKLGLPGGFLDAGETAEEGMIREIKEEVGLSVTDMQYLSSFPNHYHWGGIHYDTIDLFYTARATTHETNLDPVEVAGVQWIKKEAVRLEDLAFPSFIRALQTLD